MASRTLSQPSPRIPLLSFFTGAGFLDIGFREAGFRSVWHNEFNERFVESFIHGMRSLYGEQEELYVDQRSVDMLGPNEIFDRAFGRERPGVFGIIGGPPCPDFSVGGKNRGREGENGRLSQTYVNLICRLNPTFFLFENVPGLIRTKKHRTFFDHLKNQLRDNGYVLTYELLNALEFGVPQDRERVFMIGFKQSWVEQKLGRRIDRNDETWFTWPEPLYPGAKNLPWPTEDAFEQHTAMELPAGIPRELTVYNCLFEVDLNNPPPNWYDRFAVRKERRFREVPEGDTSKKSFKRLHRYRYSPTAAYGNNEVHLHPTERRRLSVREALRIQTVDDKYAMPSSMSLSDKFKTIGNGVPVKLAQQVADAIRRFIEG